MENKKTAIIIGAGPAGLTAAYELLKKTDIHPIILEGSSTIGGISQTVAYKGNHIDIGGHRFFSKSEEVNQIWSEVMPLQGTPAADDLILNRINEHYVKDGPNPENDDVVMLIRHRVSRILYLHKFFDYPISLSTKTLKSMGFSRTMRAGFGYLGSMVHKRKEDSLENFYINRFGKPLYGMFFEKYTEKVWGRHPSEIDASWGAQRVKGLSLWKTLTHALAKPFRRSSKHVETSLIEEFFYPKKGPGQLYEVMAQKVIALGGEIIMRAEVVKIEANKNEITGLVYEHEGEAIKITGDYYISSMPLKDLFLALGEREDNHNPYEVATRLVYRDFITVGLLLNKILLKNETNIKTINNLIPDTWIYVQEEDVNVGRLQIFNNWSPYMVDDFQKHVWLGMEYFVNEGDAMWEMKDKDFIAMAIDELARIKVINPEDVIDSVRIKIKKAYPAYFDTYKDIDVVIDYLNTFTNLFCIGRNGQHRYNNMDHSMLTAIETVKSIQDPINFPKENIWKVNTEKEYHEEKK